LFVHNLCTYPKYTLLVFGSQNFKMIFLQQNAGNPSGKEIAFPTGLPGVYTIYF